MGRRLTATLLATIALSACTVPAAPGVKETPRPSLVEALSRATGGPVRMEREGEQWIAYVDQTDDAPLADLDRAGAEQRARAIFDAAGTALEIDPSMLGPITWFDHPSPSAYVSELWPGTREPTTHGLCVVFDKRHRPMWINVAWSSEIAARRDPIKDSRAVLAALEAHAPPDTVWTREPRLSLEGGRPLYRFRSSSAEIMDATTTVDAATGAVLHVRVVRFAD
jgi:hypothetical protein